jgi:serine/threonine-protein kinase RsbW
VDQGLQQLDAREGDLHVRVPADPGRLTGLRHALSEWAEQVGLPPADREALTLASYEAMANAVEHAYAGRLQGMIELTAVHESAAGRVVVTVTDYGSWRTPPGDVGTRGRGLTLIRGLTPDSAIMSSDRGTTVSMSWPLPS